MGEGKIVYEKNPNRNKWLVGAAVFLVVLVALYFGLDYLVGEREVVNENGYTSPENVGLEEPLVWKDPTGVIILSAPSKNAEVKASQTYSINLEKETMELQNESARFGDISSGFVEFADVNEPENFFFKAVAPVGAADNYVNVMYYADVSESSISDYSTAANQQFGTMAWTAAGERLSYATLNEEFSYTDDAEIVADVANWNVIVADLEGNVTLEIPSAVNPDWSPDGSKLVYLSPGSVVLHDISTDTPQSLLLIDSNGGPIGIGNTIAISPDGRYLALTTTQGIGRVEIYEIDWELADATLVGRIVNEDVEYQWPTFSPDGNHYAVLAFDLDEQGNRVSSRLEIRATMNREVLRTLPLDEFVANQIIIDDWIAKPAF